MKWTQMPAGTLDAAQKRLWLAFGDSADEVARRINTSPVFLNSIALFAQKSASELLTPQETARTIMGENFFGPKEAEEYMGIELTKGQLKELSEVPFTTEVLERHKDTHLLIAVLPSSILDFVRNCPALFYESDAARYKKKKFMKEKGEPEWHLLRKSAVGYDLPLDEVENFVLAGQEELPPARVVVYANLVHYLSRNQWLFWQTEVRCAENESEISPPGFLSRLLPRKKGKCYHISLDTSGDRLKLGERSADQKLYRLAFAAEVKRLLLR